VFERFTDRARRVLVLAQVDANTLNHPFIGTEHILLGLLDEGEGVAAKTLESFDISHEAVVEAVEEIIGVAGSMPSGAPPFTPRAKKVLELALREALQLGHSYIGTEHMLLGLVAEGEGVAAQVLVGLGADLGRVRQKVFQLMAGFEGQITDPVSYQWAGGAGRPLPRLRFASSEGLCHALRAVCGGGYLIELATRDGQLWRGRPVRAEDDALEVVLASDKSGDRAATIPFDQIRSIVVLDPEEDAEE
jgi:hypothetical protein